MLVWQSAHTLFPTKCAPSIRGGSTTLRSSVEQELTSKAGAPTSASATMTAYQAFISDPICGAVGGSRFVLRRHLTKGRGHFKLQLHSGTNPFAGPLREKRFAWTCTQLCNGMT